LAHRQEMGSIMMIENYLHNTDITLRLRDGRTLGAAITGNADGYPVFHFHGSSSSRLEVSLMSSLAEQHGVLLIGLDRPGYGLSDPKPGARLVDWTQDVFEAADQLEIDRFAVDGISAGGPYALACAYQIPARLTACGLISSAAPGPVIRQSGPVWMRLAWGFGEYSPGLMKLIVRLVIKNQTPSLAEAEEMLRRPSHFMSETDHKLMQDARIRSGVAQAYVEGLRSGAQGDRDGAIALLSPWGFTPQQVQLEHLYLWHGEDDQVMPVAPLRLLAQQLPHCTARFYPGEGHFSLIFNHFEEILMALKGSSGTVSNV
jgi:pimeloyl-ACP methyl ester carboxylesterase